MMRRWNPVGSFAIVTGASSGIGRQLTLLLAAKGATVIAVARRRERLEQLQEEAKGALEIVVGDVVDPATREFAMSIIDAKAGGKLDLLVNNAGIGAIGLFSESSPDRLRQIMEVNFFAPVAWIRDAIPRMKQVVASERPGPVVCNIGSVLGHRAVPEKSEYCASKFAIHGFSDAIRAELSCEGITVTLVSPSTTQSEFFDSLIDTDPSAQSKSFGQWTAERVARSALTAIQTRRAEVILSLGGKALVYADRISPPLVNRILTKR